MTLTEIRAALDSRGLRPLKQLGQNFLHDKNLAAWLAAQAVEGLDPGAEIVEIGPGLGALTFFLLQHDVKVIALEMDRGLSVFLREQFAPEIAAGRLDLRHGDALQILPTLDSSPRAICGNLPYYISTPLLMECLALPGSPSQFFFVMQKEVGQRLAAAPGSKAYGALSVLVQVGHEVDLVRTLSGSVFFPAPEIDSIAVRLRPLARPLLANSEHARFTDFVQRGFSQRRKKLSNLLPTKDARRAEELKPADWIDLWREVEALSPLSRSPTV